MYVCFSLTCGKSYLYLIFKPLDGFYIVMSTYVVTPKKEVYINCVIFMKFEKFSYLQTIWFLL